MLNVSSTDNKKGFLSELLPIWVAIFGLVFATGSLVAQEAESSEDSDKVEEESDDDLVEEVVEEEDDSEDAVVADDDNMEEVYVTGSNMLISDPTANIQRYSTEDFQRMGVSDWSDFFRKIPQQFNSTNPQTSTMFATGDELGGDSGGVYFAQNLATVNLHGMGSGNTLVLLDGRRVAGFGGSERDIVNILGIPIQAIEAVEIMLDGGSAVYGVDAIAGVVNFITKKDYRGVSFNLKQDNSSTGADDSVNGVTFGFSVAKFRTTISIESSEREPIINAKTGHSSRDMSALFGPEFDFRYYTASQPGIVFEWNGDSQFPGPYYWDPDTWQIDWEKRNFRAQLPPDHSGLNATVDDFNYGIENLMPYDHVAPVNGAHTSRDSGVMNVYYDLNEKIELFALSRYSRNDSFQQNFFLYDLSIRLAVPATNAYNPFGRTVFVAYMPGRENETGTLPVPFRRAHGIDKNLTTGLKWKWYGENEIEFSVTESRSNNTVRLYRASNVRERYAPGTEEFYHRLSSPDPDVAFNVFGNGTVGGVPFDQFLRQSSITLGTNRITSWRVLAKGFWFEMNGERVSYSVNYQRTATRYTNRFLTYLGLSTYEFDYNAVWNGVTEPVRRNDLLGFEIWLPVLSAEQTAWWGQELQITVKNAFTADYNWGAIDGFTGSFDFVPVEVWNPDTQEWEEDYGYDINYGVRPDATFVKYTDRQNAPSFGLYYEFRDNVKAVLNFQRNVQPPLTSQLFDSLEAGDYFIYDVIDPWDPRGEQFYDRVPYRFSWANPGLGSEVSENWSLRVEYGSQFHEGLHVSATYRHATLKGKIQRPSSFSDIELSDLLRHPDIGVRTPEGYLDYINNDYFNSHQELDRTLTFKVQYRLQTDWLGVLDSIVNMNRIFERSREPIEGFETEALGTAEDPDKYKGSLQFLWDKGKMSASLTGFHTPGYLNAKATYCTFEQWLLQVGECAFDGFWRLHYIALDVASMTTWDLSFSYDFNPSYQFIFNSNNLFDRNGPLTVRGAPGNPVPYDPTRWDARGRVLSISLRYTPAF